MSNVASVGQVQGVTQAASGSRAAAAPPSAPAARSNLGADTAAVSARAGVPATLSLTPRSGVNLATFFRGVQQGQTLELGATGFFGSGMVGGDGRVATLNANRIQFQMNVSAPGTKRQETVSYERQGEAFVSRDGVRFNAELSSNGRTLTLTNQANARQRIVFESPRSGTFHMTAFGFEHSGKTITFTAR